MPIGSTTGSGSKGTSSISRKKSPRILLLSVGSLLQKFQKPFALKFKTIAVTQENKTRVENVTSFEYMKISRLESAALYICPARNSPGALDRLECSTMPETPQSPVSRQESGRLCPLFLDQKIVIDPRISKNSRALVIYRCTGSERPCTSSLLTRSGLGRDDTMNQMLLPRVEP